TRLDENGRVAHFASAGFDLARIGRDIIDLINPVSEIEAVRIWARRNKSDDDIVQFFVNMRVLSRTPPAVVMTFLKFVILPFFILKDVADMFAHLAVGTIDAIRGRSSAPVVD